MRLSPAVLLVAALAAGWIDAVIGGGGLVLIPAMLIAFPTVAPATALGTNKLAAIWGTGAAAIAFSRVTAVPRRLAEYVAEETARRFEEPLDAGDTCLRDLDEYDHLPIAQTAQEASCPDESDPQDPATSPSDFGSTSPFSG